MGVMGNGTSPSANGAASGPAVASSRCPRRVVLLRGAEDGEVEQVLREYQGDEVSGRRLHEDVQRLAAEHRGQFVAAEWLGALGWTRFLWCRTPEDEK